MTDSNEALIAKDRVANSTKVALNPEGGPEMALVGIQGAVAYALLDVANAIREAGQRPDPQTKRLLSIADLLVDAIKEKDTEHIERLASSFKMEREGIDVDQVLGALTAPDGK